MGIEVATRVKERFGSTHARFYVVADIGLTIMTWRVYRVVGYGEPPNEQVEYFHLHTLEDGQSVTTDDIESAKPWAVGTLNQYGCLEFHLETRHFCGRAWARTEFATAIDAVYSVAAKYMDRFDKHQAP